MNKKQFTFSRNTFLKNSSYTGLLSFFSLQGCFIKAQNSDSKNKALLDFFNAVPTSTEDIVQVPRGFRAEVLVSWGDPLFKNSPKFNQKNTAADQELQFGDNNDAFFVYPLGPNRALLVSNNEYTNYRFLFENEGKSLTADQVKKAQAAVGVSIVEITKSGDNWKIDSQSNLNRRITANTEMLISGPAAGHDLIKTNADKTGLKVLGTFNNCANGKTPWGTYLTCEENFNGFFGTDREFNPNEAQKRYGINSKSFYRWHKHDQRFDLTVEPNEGNRFGYVVEIDPMDPKSTPKKRTALGRFKHENAECILDEQGHLVVYMGDDERGEFLYKYRSKQPFKEGDRTHNDKLLDEGTLFVAVFNGEIIDMKGEGMWVELSHGENGLTKENGFPDQATILINARLAATHVGATPMDRPEWVACHPSTKDVYVTLTNNKNRGKVDGQDVDAVNPRKSNPYGHIVKIQYVRGSHSKTTFKWDLFAMAGNPSIHKDLYAGSSNITVENMFNSPDGISFDYKNRMWIMTDGNYSNSGLFLGMGNNQLLCADTESGEIKRFLSGPNSCEVTGLDFSEDRKTLFVGIQHPGEWKPDSHFPGGGTSIPRSSIIQIRREDGKEI